MFIQNILWTSTTTQEKKSAKLASCFTYPGKRKNSSNTLHLAKKHGPEHIFMQSWQLWNGHIIMVRRRVGHIIKLDKLSHLCRRQVCIVNGCNWEKCNPSDEKILELTTYLYY